jgi:hypothetical protein
MRRMLFVFAAIMTASPAFADGLVETGCDVLATGSDGKIDAILTGTRVLEPTRTSQAFSITLPKGYHDASVRCDRSDLIPAENDWKVVRAGYPLFISDTATNQMIVLELDKGQFKAETIKGRPTPTQDQFNLLQQRMDQLQTSMDAADLVTPQQK